MGLQKLINHINKKYTYTSNKLTNKYTEVYGLPCDIYFPIYPAYKSNIKYRDMKVFGPHQQPNYPKQPDIEKTLYYIPFLIKPGQNMNSSEEEFDAFYTDDAEQRPYIETTKKRELELMTKVVVFQGESQMKFFVDKKLVVTGADGFMLLRMYLSPLAKDNNEEELEEEQQEEFIINIPEEDEE